MSFQAIVLASAFIFLGSALQNSTELYPRLSCHPHYLEEMHRGHIEECFGKPKIKQNETLELRDEDYDRIGGEFFKAVACYESCALNALGIIHSYPSDKEYARKGGYGEHPFIFKLDQDFSWFYIGRIFPHIPFHENHRHKLINNTERLCAAMVDEVVNIPKSNCDKWGPLYDCVDKALGCY